MWISRSGLGALLAALVAATSLAVAVGAFGSRGSGHDGDGGNRGGHGHALLEASLAPSLPSDPPFHGVTPGGAPWVLDRGEVEIRRSGRFELRVRGLVIPSPDGDDTPGGVTTVSASLFCGADAETVPADTTDQAAISRDGDARIRDRSFDVPDDCLAPVVLVHPNGNTARYIAVSGQRD